MYLFMRSYNIDTGPVLGFFSLVGFHIEFSLLVSYLYLLHVLQRSLLPFKSINFFFDFHVRLISSYLFLDLSAFRIKSLLEFYSVFLLFFFSLSKMNLFLFFLVRFIGFQHFMKIFSLFLLFFNMKQLFCLELSSFYSIPCSFFLCLHIKYPVC